MFLRFKIFVILLVLGGALQAQHESSLMVFNAAGSMSVKRGTQTLTKLNGLTLQKNDILKVQDGSITIISADNKRIVISSPGTYTYGTLAELLSKEHASLSNRYFVYVWDKMNKDEQPTNTPGGIVRGDEVLLLPADSVTILTDSVAFFFPNEELHKYVLTISDNTYDIIYQTSFNDSVYATSVIQLECTKPGRFMWELSVPYVKSPDARCYFIPDEATRTSLLEAYKKAVAVFDAYPEAVKNELIRAYCEENRIYLY